MKIKPYISTFFLFLFLACSSSKKIPVSKNEEVSYQKLFIVANTKDIMTRVRLEKGLAETAAAKEYQSVKSIDVLPYSLDDPKQPSMEEFEIKLKETGCDALLIIQYLQEGETISYKPGTQSRGYTHFIVGILSGVWNLSEPMPIKEVSTPGNFIKNNKYYLSVALIDQGTKEIKYSERSDAFDEMKLESFIPGYYTTLVKNLETKKHWVK